MSGHDHSHGADAASQRGQLIIVFAITATVMLAATHASAASRSSKTPLAKAAPSAWKIQTLALAAVSTFAAYVSRRRRGAAVCWPFSG